MFDYEVANDEKVIAGFAFESDALAFVDYCYAIHPKGMFRFIRKA